MASFYPPDTDEIVQAASSENGWQPPESDEIVSTPKASSAAPRPLINREPATLSEWILAPPKRQPVMVQEDGQSFVGEIPPELQPKPQPVGPIVALAPAIQARIDRIIPPSPAVEPPPPVGPMLVKAPEPISAQQKIRRQISPEKGYDYLTTPLWDYLPEGLRNQLDPGAFADQVAKKNPDDKFMQTVDGVINGVGGFAKPMTEPDMIALMGMGDLPPAARKLVDLGFAVQMASKTPAIATELWTEMGKAPDQRDHAKIARLITEGVLITAFAARAGKHGLLREAKPGGPDFRGMTSAQKGAYGGEQVARMLTGKTALPEPPPAAPALDLTKADDFLQQRPVGDLNTQPTAPSKEPSLTPALIVNGKPIIGGRDHFGVVDAQPTDAGKADALLAFADDSKGKEHNHVFLDENRNVLSRKQAAPIYDKMVGNNPGTTKELFSHNLSDGLVYDENTHSFSLPKKEVAPLPEPFKPKPTEIDKMAAEKSFSGKNKNLSRADIESGKVKSTEGAMEALINNLRASNDPASVIKEWAQWRDRLYSERGDLAENATQEEIDRFNRSGNTPQIVREAIENIADFGNDKFSKKVVDLARALRERGSTKVEPGAAKAAPAPTIKTDPINSKLISEPEVETVPLDPQSGNPLEKAGMGAANIGEVEVQGNPDIHGIAARVRSEREAAGQTAPTSPGTGISAPDSVAHGQELLQKGASPEAAISNFEATKRLSSDDMALVRAHGEKLAKDARQTEEKFGTDSNEYAAAWQRLSDWDARTKPMQTEWHKTGMAQQGEVDLDTGSFTGLQRLKKQTTGKDFEPGQKKTAKETAKRVKSATKEADTARRKLYRHLDESIGISDAEKMALEAANKTVREASARMADAASKDRVADAVLKREIQKTQEAATRSAIEAANKTVRESSARKAVEESRQRVKNAQSKKDASRVALEAAKKALDRASQTVREAAIRAAAEEVKNRVSRSDPANYAWSKAREYIDQGMDNFDDIRHKLATDMGVPVKDVTRALAKTKQAKTLTDEMWRKQQTARRVQEQARRWVSQADMPGYKKAIASVPRVLFTLKVGFDGTVALGTHAAMVAYQPRFWNAYVKNFVKMYRMVGSRSYYEMQVQDLLRKPNYVTARRAGLVNDPFHFEDYKSPDVAQYVGGLSGMGNRGYSVLKMLRQDMFDQHWRKLPRSAQVPEMAMAIADGINHATGVVKVQAPRWTNIALFATRLDMSRGAWLFADPVRATDAFLRWNKATPAEKYFAINQVKEKAWVAGTLYGLLALNQGFLSASGSNQKINFTDPMRSDFLKFKVAGMDLSYGNAMLSMARLPVRLYSIRSSDGGKLKNLIYPDEDTYSVLGQYARSQLSPFASLASTLWLKADYENRPLPNSERPVPKRLRQQGVSPYTWPEFWAEQFTPIPVEEALREVWQGGMGMSSEQVKNMRKAMATIAVMQATGARLTDDTRINPESPVSAGYTKGQIIQRGGKDWRVEGFDKDGEPLVSMVTQ